jgi:hypothetical protein
MKEVENYSKIKRKNHKTKIWNVNGHIISNNYYIKQIHIIECKRILIIIETL